MRGHSSPFFEPEMIEKALTLLIDHGQIFEIRILEPKRTGRGYAPRVIFGYFDAPAKVIPAFKGLQLDGAKGIYVTLNPINPALLARCQNKFSKAKDGQTTADKDIVRRYWLLVDADPKRPAGISASDEEKNYAHEKARAVYGHLQKLGWSEPIAADSGNGFHLLYRIDMPPESEVVKHCLSSLDKQFSDEKVSIDTTVCNPARIVKLYGTLAAKGDDCPDIGRPHRMSKVLRVPDEIKTVPAEILDALAAQVVKANAPSVPKTPTLQSKRTDRKIAWDEPRVQKFIDQYLVHCKPGLAIPYDGGFKWVLDICPFNAEHTNRSAVIVIKADGTLGFKCHHDGCKENDWKALRARFEPQHCSSSTKLIIEGDDELFAQYGPLIMLNKDNAPAYINQMFVAAKYARDNLILHEPALNQFYEYDSDTGLWKPKTEARLIVELGIALREMLVAYAVESLLKKRSEPVLNQILRILRGIVEKPDIFHQTRPIIHVGNGVLHLDVDPPTLNEFSPDYFSRNRSEVCYDEGADCPRFFNELLRPALNEDDIALLQRYAGQCLLGRNPSQKLLLLRGTPGGGKSTLANVLEAIIGTHNVTQLRVQHLGERFEIAGFVGKTLLAGKDVPGDFLNNKSAHMLKSLVGGDRLDAEQKNVKHRFELLGEFNIIITSNSRLHVRLDADSGAWRRRLLIVDYERPSTDKPIPNLDRILVETEGAGILNWCVAGALDLLDELKTTGRFILTDAQMRRVDALLCESDSVRHFITEMIEAKHGTDVTVSELQTAYHDFCEHQGWQTVTIRQFENQVSNIMLEIHRAAKRTDIKRDGKSQRGFAHVAIRETGDL